MILKKGVIVKNVQPEIILAIMVAWWIWLRYGRRILVVTDLWRKPTARRTLHNRDDKCYATDLRSRYFTPKKKAEIVRRLKESLTDDYDVVSETDHIHIEYDPK